MFKLPNHSVLLLLLLLSTTFPDSFYAFTLITFDVDGTLVKGSGQRAESSAHARAFSHACGTVLGNGVPVRPVAQALAPQDYHGSTDGLILCRLAKAELGIEDVSEDQLNQLFQVMYGYVAALDDAEVARGIDTLPGVLGHLMTLSQLKSTVNCGLVTGNVEGIARRKMRAVGVLQTGALAQPSPEQLARPWPGSDALGFLGGFGSDYCSRNVQDADRNYLDRGEQIAIAARRCQGNNDNQSLKRVVHVGDAPSDVLAAKSFAQSISSDRDFCVGLVGVATGSYSADQLREAAGEPLPGRWEPLILEQGMADPYFLDACGL